MQKKKWTENEAAPHKLSADKSLSWSEVPPLSPGVRVVNGEWIPVSDLILFNALLFMPFDWKVAAAERKTAAEAAQSLLYTHCRVLVEQKLDSF